MKSTILFITLGLILAGCATTDYYTNGYSQTVYGGLCENCNRAFGLTSEIVNTCSTAICPFCGREQDLKMSMNRYNYAVQQQQAYNNQQAMGQLMQGMGNIMQIQRDSAQRKQQIILDHISRTSSQPTTTIQPTMQPGDSRFNPIYIKKVDDNY